LHLAQHLLHSFRLLPDLLVLQLEIAGQLLVKILLVTQLTHDILVRHHHLRLLVFQRVATTLQLEQIVLGVERRLPLALLLVHKGLDLR
jgi:hypothetical protein